MALNSPRRDFLRKGGALVTAGASAGLSGCVGRLLGIDDDSPSATATVGRWVPARNVLSDLFERDPNGYGVTYLDLRALVSADDRVEGDLLRGTMFRFDERFGVFDLVPRDVSFRLYNPFWDVLRWDHDPAETASLLQDAGFERTAKHADFAVFGPDSGSEASSNEGDAGSDEDRLFAFDGTHLVHTLRRRWRAGKAITGLERLLDTKTGEFDRFAAENDTVAELLDAANAGDLLSISQFDSFPESRAVPEFGLFEGLTGRCFSGRFDDEQFRRQDLYQFPDREAVDMDAIEEYVDALEAEEDGFGHATETTVKRHGHLVEVTYALPLASMIE